MERIITKSFARLMGRGTHRGFITYEELNKSLGKRNLSDENLAQAFIHILDEKVSLVEKKSDFKVLRKKDNTSKEEGKSIESIIKNGFDEEIVQKITRLVDMNVYKRNQAAPGIKTTPLAFGVGRRIPIVQKYAN